MEGSVTLDVVVDGADQVDSDRNLIKGHGVALLREKFVVAAARRFLVVAERSKRDRQAQPVEVVRFAWPETQHRLLDLVPAATLRRDRDGAALVTDEANHILDCAVPPGPDLAELAAAINATLGVVEHGLSSAWPTKSSSDRPTAVSRRSRVGKANDSAPASDPAADGTGRSVARPRHRPSLSADDERQLLIATSPISGSGLGANPMTGCRRMYAASGSARRPRLALWSRGRSGLFPPRVIPFANKDRSGCRPIQKRHAIDTQFEFDMLRGASS